MKRILIALFFLFMTATPFTTSAFQASLGVFQQLDTVQDINGVKVPPPYSPSLSLGHEFEFYWGLTFIPQLGYILNQTKANDTYGPYKVSTLFLAYDFGYDPNWSQLPMLFRFGLGNFMKTVKGDGGTVTIPNGAGTATAYRPGSSTSYSSTLNLGFDFKFSSTLGGLFKDFGLRFTTYFLEPLQKEKFQTSYLLDFTGYF